MATVPLSDDVSDQEVRDTSSEDALNQSSNLRETTETNNDASITIDTHMETSTNQKQLLQSPDKAAQDARDGEMNDNPDTSTNNDDQSILSLCSLEVSFCKPNETPRFDEFLKSQSRRSTLGANKVSTNEQKIDGYVRSGAHFRSLLEYAFSKVSNGVSQAQFESNDLSMRAIHHHDARSDEEISRKRNFTEEGNSLPQDDVRPLRRRRLDLMIDNANENDERYDSFQIDGGRSGKKYASELAREKMAEVLKLKRLLKEAEEHAVAMTQVNATIREVSANTSAKMTRTREALRIAGQNAANARADADATEARAASLASQVNSMKSILDETKRTCDSIRKEHDEISAASRSLEGRLMQTESDLNKLDKEKRQGDEERNALREEVEHIIIAKKKLQMNLDEKDDEASKLTRKLAECVNVEQARAERTNRIEIELRETKSMLLDATSAATEAESTIGVLQESIKELHRENKTYHDKIAEIIENFGKDKERLQNSLGDSESESQKLRIKESFDKEELQRLNLNQTTREKEISQLKIRLSDLEKRLTETELSDPVSTTTTSPISKLHFTSPVINNNTVSEARRSSNEVFVIPPLRLASPKVMSVTNTKDGKENRPSTNILPRSIRRRTLGSAPLKSTKCCICLKPAYGIMKSCQCGRPVCDKRAHASCTAGINPLPSVSHPGTPAPLLPCVLCKPIINNSELSRD